MQIDFYILSGDVSPNIWAKLLAMFRLIGLHNNIQSPATKSNQFTLAPK